MGGRTSEKGESGRYDSLNLLQWDKQNIFYPES